MQQRSCFHLSSKIVETIQNFDTETKAKFETLPFLYIIFDFAMASSEKSVEQRTFFCNAIMERIKQIYPISITVFNQRTSLYDNVINGKHVRCDWSFGNSSLYNSNPLAKCAALLCDILYNPKCANDYDNAPLMVYGLDISLRYSMSVANPIVQLTADIFERIYDL